MKCEHKKTKMKLCIAGFANRIHPRYWFKMKKCCTDCGVIIEGK